MYESQFLKHYRALKHWSAFSQALQEIFDAIATMWCFEKALEYKAKIGIQEQGKVWCTTERKMGVKENVHAC